MEPAIHSKRRFLFAFDTWIFCFLVAPNDNRNDNRTITKNAILGLGKAETGFKMSFAKTILSKIFRECGFSFRKGMLL